VWRIVVGCLLVLALSAATTVVFIKGEIKTLATDLSFHKALKLSSRSLAPVGFGDPQTILLIGNDQRNHTTTTPVLPHSNEMLLVRIDPSKPWISMMSIPRELQVTLQTASGAVTTRLNAALIYGGMPLLLSTIKQLTGLSINKRPRVRSELASRGPGWLSYVPGAGHRTAAPKARPWKAQGRCPNPRRAMRFRRAVATTTRSPSRSTIPTAASTASARSFGSSRSSRSRSSPQR
jgi:hypothetical protein